jgi:hypothetical protein
MRVFSFFEMGKRMKNADVFTVDRLKMIGRVFIPWHKKDKTIEIYQIVSL